MRLPADGDGGHPLGPVPGVKQAGRSAARQQTSCPPQISAAVPPAADHPFPTPEATSDPAAGRETPHFFTSLALDYPDKRRYLQVMELLDLLEQRVDALLTEMTALREENRRLREDAEAGRQRIGEIRALQEELARERQVREQALTRVDALLHRIQTSLGEGPEDNPFVSVAGQASDDAGNHRDRA